MKSHAKLTLARWLTTTALITSVFLTARCALFIYFAYRVGGVFVHQPPSAEEISRKAAPFQNDSPEINGMFNIVKTEHLHLVVMYDRLVTETHSAWALAMLGAFLGLVVSALLGASLLLTRASRSHGDQ